MLIEIDFSSEQAIYMQLHNQIVIAIAKEELKDGESLPSVRQMADELGVNMHTVNKAYSILKQEGYLKLDRRTGAVICLESGSKPDHIASLHQEMEMIIAKAICKDITKDEMSRIVSDMYDMFFH